MAQLTTRSSILDGKPTKRAEIMNAYVEPRTFAVYERKAVLDHLLVPAPMVLMPPMTDGGSPWVGSTTLEFDRRVEHPL
jgi:hypothetical protein